MSNLNLFHSEFDVSKNNYSDDRVDWCSYNFKEGVIKTTVEGVSFKVVSRYMSGRKRSTPVFHVIQKRKNDKSELNEIVIPIPSLGWRKAWKQALLSLSANSGRRHIVRYLNRPPKISDFLSN